MEIPSPYLDKLIDALYKSARDINIYLNSTNGEGKELSTYIKTMALDVMDKIDEIPE